MDSDKTETKEKPPKDEGFQFNKDNAKKNVSGMEAFCQFVWNQEKKEFFGRTGMSWLKITVFYIIYYTFLAGFFMLMLLAFFTTLYDEKPTWIGDDNGIIGTNPGVGFRPRPPNERIESTLIWFRHGSDNGNWEPWVERLESHMADYKNKTRLDQFPETHGVECGELGSLSPGTTGMCKVNQEELFSGPCTSDQNYGFKDGKPCVLIKLNKIYNWTPQPYESEEDFPEDIPESIVNSFRQNIIDEKPELNNRVWLECDGENPADKENIGEITYYPTNGVSKNFYPYVNQKGYLSPVIFAHLENPKHGIMMAVECKAWAKNIRHDSQERRGLVHFELMID